jgi:hypothetical protein
MNEHCQDSDEPFSMLMYLVYNLSYVSVLAISSPLQSPTVTASGYLYAADLASVSIVSTAVLRIESTHVGLFWPCLAVSYVGRALDNAGIDETIIAPVITLRTLTID